MSVSLKSLLLACAVSVAAAPAFAQSEPATKRPDLEGVWSNQSLTNLSRQPGTKLSVTEQEAKELIENNPWILLAASEEGASDFGDGLLDDGNSDRGYNTFWIDPGQSLAKVKGEIRTSWLVEPADGRVPVSPTGQKARTDAAAKKRATMYEGPETLPIAERCLVGFTNAGGPGMLNTIYNNNYQIVQAPDHVMILVEMVHDARIVPTFASAPEARRAHRPDAIKPWLGDSVGWYEGGTLVVETINIRPEQVVASAIPVSPSGKFTERFTRIADGEIFYEFSVDDPAIYSGPWRAELSFYATKEQVHEYACHEGNHAMAGILEGARQLEREKIAAAGMSIRR